MIEFDVLKTSGSKKIYFFAGNLVIGSSVKNFISGVYEKEVINKTSAMELLREIEDFVKVKVRENTWTKLSPKNSLNKLKIIFINWNINPKNRI